MNGGHNVDYISAILNKSLHYSWGHEWYDRQGRARHSSDGGFTVAVLSLHQVNQSSSSLLVEAIHTYRTIACTNKLMKPNMFLQTWSAQTWSWRPKRNLPSFLGKIFIVGEKLKMSLRKRLTSHSLIDDRTHTISLSGITSIWRRMKLLVVLVLVTMMRASSAHTYCE